MNGADALRSYRIVSNFQTLGAVATVTFSVPSGARWIVLYGTAERDQNATFSADIRDASDKVIGHLLDALAAGVTKVYMPSDSHFPCPCVLEEGYDITFTWGAAQTTPEVALVVLEARL